MYKENERLEIVAFIIGLIMFGLVNIAIIVLTGYIFTLTGSVWSFLLLLCLFTISRKK